MAAAAQTRTAKVYAQQRGYQEGEGYSPFDMGAGFTAHRGHGYAVYRGVNNGHLEFRCEGCGDAVFVLPG